MVLACAKWASAKSFKTREKPSATTASIFFAICTLVLPTRNPAFSKWWGPGNTALVGPELQPGTGADAMENGSQFTLPSLPGRLAITRQLARMVGRRRAPTKAGSEPPTRGNPGTFAAN